MGELTLRQKENWDLIRRIGILKNVARRWFYYAGTRFLQSHELTDEQEDFLQEITDFYTNHLDNIENDKSFLKKIEFGPIASVKRKEKSTK